MWRGISLANKCLLLFGAAVVLIIISALAVPWIRMNSIVDEAQKDLSRQLVHVWERAVRDQIGGVGGGVGPVMRPGVEETIGDAQVQFLSLDRAEAVAGRRGASVDRGDDFLRDALDDFHAQRENTESHLARWRDFNTREYRFAKAVRNDSGHLTGVVLLTRASDNAGAQLAVNTAYLLSAGLMALGLALLVFYLITNKLILSPVRDLKSTAELVREGNWSTRSDIQTGDEFEELSDAFNQMLENVTAGQEQLRAINQQLDLKVNELSQRNVALFEANKIKGEFLATVSHELRTPLNSIIGFAELLLETAQRDEEHAEQGTPELAKAQKRRRYLENIHNAGKSLLEMINGVLELAKVEAGKIDLQVGAMNVRDACEALVALMRPLADRGGVELITDFPTDLPAIETDTKKFQQVIFNLLSNAVKFTAEKAADARASGNEPVARVTLRAERLFGRASQGLESEDRVRISVLDTGPGIAPEDQKRIFDKFEQLDTGHTRRHEGTGLGLAIVKELTGILQGELQLESEVGRGSMFSVVFPMRLDPDRAKEMKAELAFRGKMAAAR